MVGENSVVVLAAVAARICVDDRRRQVLHLVEKGMASPFGDLVRRDDAEALVNKDLGLGVKPVADPANPNLADGLDSGNGPQRDL